jgi:DNA recombination protein RmuC
MTLLVVVLAVVAIAALAGAVFLAGRAATLHAAASSLQAELKTFKEGGLDRLVTEKLGVLTQRASEELERRELLIRELKTEVVGEQRRAAEAAERFQQDFGVVRAHLMGLRELQSQVSELNGLLKPQQFRGELGEMIVRNVLADKLPLGCFEENYTFLDGKQVEFVIRLSDRLIAIDSKLPLDDFKRMRDATDDRQRQACRTAFKRTVQKKIDEVKAYIRPEEGTYNFALMVIPSEAVYYDIVADREFAEGAGLAAYANTRNVFLASPNTFWAYLCALAQGLRGLEIERHAEEILVNLQSLSTKIRGFTQDEFRKLGSHLKDAANKYDEADRKLRDIDTNLSEVERTAPAMAEGAAAVSASERVAGRASGADRAAGKAPEPVAVPPVPVPERVAA